MAPSDELDYLKSLVTQLNEKIHVLEEKAKAAAHAHKTPAQQLRTILIGPPGAGTCPPHTSSLRAWGCRVREVTGADLDSVSRLSQERAPRHLKYEMSSVFAISRPATSSASRLLKTPSSARWRRKSSTQASLSMTRLWST